MTKYWVRCWNNEEQKVEHKTFTFEEILKETQVHQMNMADVGLILLNIERQRYGLKRLAAVSVADGIESVVELTK